MLKMLFRYIFLAQFRAILVMHALRWHKSGRKVPAREQSLDRFRRSQPEPCLAIGYNLVGIFCFDRYDVLPDFLERIVAHSSPHFSTDPLHREQRFVYEEIDVYVKKCVLKCSSGVCNLEYSLQDA